MDKKQDSFIEELDENLEILKNQKGKLISDDLYKSLEATIIFAKKSKFLRLRYLFCGSISSGKSSIINLILRKNILEISTMKCTEWPLIIRHHDEEKVCLYTAKISQNNEFEYEPDQLISNDINEIILKIAEYNSSRSRKEQFQKMKQSGKIDFSNFICILYAKIHFVKNLEEELKDRFEIWDLPGVNDVEDDFNNELRNHLFEIEAQLSKKLAIFHLQRIHFLMISDFVSLNQKQVASNWQKFTEIRLNWCKSQMIIINKKDTMTFNNCLMLIKENIPEKLIDLIFSKYKLIDSRTNLKTDIESLTSYYQKLKKSDQKELDFIIREEINNYLNIFFFHENLKEKYKNEVSNSPKPTLNIKYISALHSFKEYIMLNKIYDDEGFWNIEFKNFYENIHLNSYFDNDKEKYRESVINKIDTFKDSQAVFLNDFLDLEANLVDSILTSRINQDISQSFSKILKNSIMKIEGDEINSVTDKEMLLKVLKELKSLFNIYFSELSRLILDEIDKLCENIKTINENQKSKIKDLKKSFWVYNESNCDNIMKLYIELFNNLKLLNESIFRKIHDDKKLLYIHFKQRINELNIDSSIIDFYIKETDEFINTQITSIESKFLKSNQEIFSDFAVGNNNGLISLVTTGVVRLAAGYGAEAIGARVLTTFLSGPVGWTLTSISLVGIYLALKNNSSNFKENKKKVKKGFLKLKEDSLENNSKFEKNITNLIRIQKEKSLEFIKLLKNFVRKN